VWMVCHSLSILVDGSLKGYLRRVHLSKDRLSEWWTPIASQLHQLHHRNMNLLNQVMGELIRVVVNAKVSSLLISEVS
jgi:hypothetical protein